MHWKWEVTGYYKSGTRAFITTHATEWSKDLEVSAAKSRGDIGRVDVRDLRLTRVR